FKGHEKGVTCLAFYPTSEKADILISGSADKTVRVWDIEKGKDVGEPRKGNKDEVRSVAFVNDGRSFVAGGKDGTATIYQLDGKQMTTLADLHLGSIDTIAAVMLPVQRRGFTPGILTGSSDQTTRFFALITTDAGKTTAEPVGNFRSHTGPITSVLTN